jgi:hypothetical protein
MKLRHPSSRWALWVFAAALLLKSAMPWLASASAQLQGKTLVEVCTVYGVALVPQSGHATDPAPDHPPDHAGGAASDAQADILQALVALGYSDRDAALALKALPPDVGVSDGIKLALKALGK